RALLHLLALAHRRRLVAAGEADADVAILARVQRGVLDAEGAAPGAAAGRVVGDEGAARAAHGGAEEDVAEPVHGVVLERCAAAEDALTGAGGDREARGRRRCGDQPGRHYGSAGEHGPAWRRAAEWVTHGRAGLLAERG